MVSLGSGRRNPLSQVAGPSMIRGRPVGAVQELIWRIQPDLIVETGIAHGGSLIFSAAMLELNAACGGPAPSTAPSESAGPAATPGPTPVALLTEPANADQVYRALVAAGLKLQANTAIGGPGQDPLKVIQASYAGWPLAIGQWSSSKTLHEALYWKPGAKPGDALLLTKPIGLGVISTAVKRGGATDEILATDGIDDT